MIAANELSFAFGDRTLYRNVTFHLGDRDRVCLAGRNGSGKTTLLKLLCSESTPDAGEIALSKELKIGFLRQEMTLEQDQTVFQGAYRAFAEAQQYEIELEALRHQLSSDPTDERSLHRLDHLQEELVRLDFYHSESRTRSTLSGLGFSETDQDRPVSQFSGGWQMRVSLARLLLERPGALFLDEPTNHLDLESILWLQAYLKTYPGTVVLISHDRDFVESVCNRLLEIDQGVVREYALPFSRYQEQKDLYRDQLLREYENRVIEMRRLERFVERFKAKATKAAQARSKQKQLERLREEQVELPQSSDTLRLQFPEAEASGKWVFQTRGLAKTYGDQVIFSGVDLDLQAGDRVAITGANGSGKTTLLQTLVRRIPASNGELEWGHNVKIGYYAQYEVPDPSDAKTDLLTLLARCDPKASPGSVRSILGAMMFSGDDVLKPFGVLSGGEQARIRLCRLLLTRCNVLILDEPTNHLDVESRQVLLEALQQFTGTVLFVSHDRFFSENLATRILWVKQGTVSDFPGNYAEYCDQLTRSLSLTSQISQISQISQNSQTLSESKEPLSSVEQSSQEKVSIRGRQGYEAKKNRERDQRKLRKEIEHLEQAIQDAESQIEAMNQRMCLPEVYQNASESRSLTKERDAIQDRIQEMYTSLERAENRLAEA